MKIKSILLSVVIAVCMVSQANAGFITGLAVGSMLSGTKSVSGTNNAQIVQSNVENHDVISCATYLGRGVECDNTIQYVTPEKFALDLGYKTIHKKGTMIVDGKIFIVMEVSK